MNIYQDQSVIISTPRTPAGKGHLICSLPKPQRLDELSAAQAEGIFAAATFCASIIFENVQAHGTTIMLTDIGKEGARVDIIARFEGDGLDLKWEAKKLPALETEALAGKIKEACESIKPEDSLSESAAPRSSPPQRPTLTENEGPEQPFKRAVTAAPFPKEGPGENQEPAEPIEEQQKKPLQRHQPRSKITNYLLRQLERIP